MGCISIGVPHTGTQHLSKGVFDMEEKRKELMALVIGMKEEEHIDSLLEVARYVSSCEDDFHNRDDMVDCLVDDISQCIDADIPRIMAFVHNCCKKF